MRLSQDEAYTHLEDVHHSIEAIQERAQEMTDEALGNHRHPATLDDPAWFDRVGCGLLDSADEAQRIVNLLEGWYEQVYSHVEDGGTINARAMTWAYRQLKAAEECL